MEWLRTIAATGRTKQGLPPRGKPIQCRAPEYLEPDAAGLGAILSCGFRKSDAKPLGHTSIVSDALREQPQRTSSSARRLVPGGRPGRSVSTCPDMPPPLFMADDDDNNLRIRMA